MRKQKYAVMVRGKEELDYRIGCIAGDKEKAVIIAAKLRCKGKRAQVVVHKDGESASQLQLKVSTKQVSIENRESVSELQSEV